MRSVGPSLVVAVACLIPGPAAGQDVQHLRPAPGTAGGFTVEGAQTPSHLEWAGSAYVHYASQPLVERGPDGEVRRRIVEHLVTTDLLATVGLWDRFELGIGVPIHGVAGDGLPSTDVEGLTLGDVRLLPKARILGLPVGQSFALSLSLAVPVSLPTGNADRFLGEGGVAIAPRLLAEGRFGRSAALLSVGGRRRPDAGGIGGLDVGAEVTYGAAFSHELPFPGLLLLAEVYGSATAEEAQAGERALPLEALLGARAFIAHGLVATAGVGRSIVADWGSPRLRVLAGLAWQPTLTDPDGDGLERGADACPGEPEDHDGFEDGDGCPEPGPESIPAVLPADTDGDGLPDSEDQCPTEPEDPHGLGEQDGCPDRDEDGDGIRDSEDRCPHDPEVVNGVDDLDGCPDEDKPKDKPKRVEVKADRIEILDKVFFESNEAVIRPESFPVLDELAEVLKDTPRLSHIRIEGHTDSTGKDAHNLELSQRRAEAVRTYLVDKGVAGERLEAKGLGETAPLGPDDTPEGQADNRRVEFHIVGGPGKTQDTGEGP